MDGSERRHGERRTSHPPAPAPSAPGGDEEQTFLSKVAHDFRNPLCAIGLNAALITELAEHDSIREAAQDVIRAMKRIEGTLAELMRLSRDPGEHDILR